MENNTTVPLEVWIDTIPKVFTTYAPWGSTILDFEGEQYLRPFITEYMTAPVAVYDGQAIAARSMMTEDLSTVRLLFAELETPVILYMVTWRPSWVEYFTVDSTTFDKVAHDKPIVHPGIWVVRFALVGEV